MRDIFVSVVGRFINWIIALYIRPTIKVTQFDIEETDDKKLRINFSAFISNNTSKTLSVSKKELVFYSGKTEVAKIDVTKCEFEKKKEGDDGLNGVYPLEDIITLQPGEKQEIKLFDHKIDVDAVSKVAFSCFTGRKNCTFRVKVPKTDSVENNSTSKEGRCLMFPLINKRETGVNLRRIMDLRGITPKDVQEYLCLLYTSPSPRD